MWIRTSALMLVGFVYLRAVVLVLLRSSRGPAIVAKETANDIPAVPYPPSVK